MRTLNSPPPARTDCRAQARACAPSHHALRPPSFLRVSCSGAEFLKRPLFVSFVGQPPHPSPPRVLSSGTVLSQPTFPSPPRTTAAFSAGTPPLSTLPVATNTRGSGAYSIRSDSPIRGPAHPTPPRSQQQPSPPPIPAAVNTDVGSAVPTEEVDTRAIQAPRKRAAAAALPNRKRQSALWRTARLVKDQSEVKAAAGRAVAGFRASHAHHYPNTR